MELEFSVYFTYGHKNTCVGCLQRCIVISRGMSNYCAFKAAVRENGFWGVEGGTEDKASLWSLCQSWIHGIPPHTHTHTLPTQLSFLRLQACSSHPAIIAFVKPTMVATWCRVLWFFFLGGGSLCIWSWSYTSICTHNMYVCVWVHM